jgi:hypothetical protein
MLIGTMAASSARYGASSTSQPAPNFPISEQIALQIGPDIFRGARRQAHRQGGARNDGKEAGEGEPARPPKSSD